MESHLAVRANVATLREFDRSPDLSNITRNRDAGGDSLVTAVLPLPGRRHQRSPDIGPCTSTDFHGEPADY